MHCFVHENADWRMLRYCGCADMYKLLSTVYDSFIFRTVEKSIHRHVCVNEWNAEDEKTR